MLGTPRSADRRFRGLRLFRDILTKGRGPETRRPALLLLHDQRYLDRVAQLAGGRRHRQRGSAYRSEVARGYSAAGHCERHQQHQNGKRSEPSKPAPFASIGWFYCLATKSLIV